MLKLNIKLTNQSSKNKTFAKHLINKLKNEKF
jgi:hypothetical protein